MSGFVIENQILNLFIPKTESMKHFKNDLVDKILWKPRKKCIKFQKKSLKLSTIETSLWFTLCAFNKGSFQQAIKVFMLHNTINWKHRKILDMLYLDKKNFKYEKIVSS